MVFLAWLAVFARLQLEVIWEDMLTNSAMSPYISSTAACADATVPIGYGLTGEGTTQTLGEAVEESSPWLVLVGLKENRAMDPNRFLQRYMIYIYTYSNILLKF